MTSGVIKKIFNQVSSLNIETKFSCKPFILPKPNNRILLYFSYLFFNIYKNITITQNIYDFIYIRRIIPVNYSFIKLLKIIKMKNNKCKIIYEIPTYPYDMEHYTVILKTLLIIDKIFRVFLKKYINKIITFTNDDYIFGVPTIKIKNGICCSDIQIRTVQTISQYLNLIVVAQFAPWHGYDRLINGLNNYYENGSSEKVYIHFIGNGQELNKYKEMVHKYNLSEYIIFHGPLFGKQLTDMFNNSDIAICGLGGHRKSIYLSSELKSREYLARGIPMISSTKIDILPDDFIYCLYVPSDDSPININNVICYYQDLISKHTLQEITTNIREFAENNCDISKTMKPVIEYLI